MITAIGAAVLLAGLLLYDRYGRASPAIRIGVLHSLSGTMAASEAPLVDAVRLAVEEVNQAGGLNGRPVEMIVSDCRSDAAYCAQQAEKLIVREGVQALFGCWTSSCRKAVREVVEKHRHLLFYPLQYEGLEQSPDIVYTGAVPNQQIIPMALWAAHQYGKRFYLVGSDYVFPRTANRMVKNILLAQGGKLLGERYLPLGAGDMKPVVEEIAAQRPDFVLNTLNGDSNLHFFRALHASGLRAAKVPVFSTSIAEVELAEIGADLLAGHFAAWNYFQSLDSGENKAFVAHFRQHFGKKRVIDDPMVNAYAGVKLWAEAVRSQGSTEPAVIKTVLQQQTLSGPQGIVAVDRNSLHLWKMAYIGKVRADGQFEIIWRSPQPIRPKPFPFYRSRTEWLAEQPAPREAKP